MADSAIAVELLDTDPYHAMKTPLIETALSPLIKGDQPEHMSHKLSEKLHKLGPCPEMYPECVIASWDALILLLDAENIE